MRSIKAILGDRETHTVNPLDSVRKAVQVMVAHNIGAVPVVDGDRVIGIFTERDVMKRVVAACLEPDSTSVATVMSTRLVSASSSESYETCLLLMQKSHVRHLVVIDDNRMSGVVSLRDLMDVDLKEKAEELALLNAYVHHIPGSVRPN